MKIEAALGCATPAAERISELCSFSYAVSFPQQNHVCYMWIHQDSHRRDTAALRGDGTRS